jgi:thioesterase domain-containing protein
MIKCIAPKSKTEFAQYYQLRWEILRAPWQQAKGSEQDEYESEAIHRILIDDEQQIVGVGRLHFTEQSHAQIRYMAINADYQGKGLGKQMIDTLEQKSAKLGARVISLNARKDAVKFYQYLGYQLLEFSHLLYNEIEHFSMTKTIEPLASHQIEISQNLQDTWHQTIPLSKAMNIAITYFDEVQLVTHCEPSFNKNLHNTMFAGSIYTLATLTAWGWVYLQLQKSKLAGDIVLADGQIKYLAPIKGVVSAMTRVDLAVGDCTALTLNKKARFTVEVEVYSGDLCAARFTGKYVVLPK